jgi:pimeloyl-ACP methyl ester carboxylesterase
MPRPIPPDHPPFAALPVRFVTAGGANERLAVHIAGRLGEERPPLLCLPGYTRNMTDFTEFASLIRQRLGPDWPVVLVDLRGRGRSSDRARAADYSSLADAADVAELARALAIDKAIVVGQGHGGQVAMALAALRPTLLAGSVLIDAGPATAARSLIRLRSNIQAIGASRGVAGITLMLRRMLAADYPDLPPEELDRLAQRGQRIDAEGRAQLLFDRALIDRLAEFEQDDVLLPQWQLFDLLAGRPMLVVTSELTDQLPRELLAEMARRAPDAFRLAIPGRGSPALLDRDTEIAAIATFVRRITASSARAA